MLDERTKGKIVICPPGLRSSQALQEMIHPSQLPRFLGGQLHTPLDDTLALPRIENRVQLDEAVRALGEWCAP
jgi:hypothetical protein